MFRRATSWLKERAALVALCGVALVPALGMAVNVAWPPEYYGYLAEQALLVALALGALALARTTVNGAVFLYCVLALWPVGAMLEYYQGIGGGWSALVLTPMLGILFVAILTRDERATLLYGGIAIVASSVFCGAVCQDAGQAGAMSFLSGGLTFVVLRWLGCNEQRLHREIDKLRKDTGELGANIHQLEQKIGATHDP